MMTSEEYQALHSIDEDEQVLIVEVPTDGPVNMFRGAWSEMLDAYAMCAEGDAFQEWCSHSGHNPDNALSAFEYETEDLLRVLVVTRRNLESLRSEYSEIVDHTPNSLAVLETLKQIDWPAPKEYK